jgi:hypothetical protein
MTLKLDPQRITIICGCLRECGHRHEEIATQLKARMNFAEAKRHDVFAKACWDIAKEVDEATKRSSTGLVITPDLH